MPGPPVSSLIFSEQANHNFSKTLGELKRSTLSISNRLHSVQEDAAFARKVASTYGRPLVANERCGSWYIDPDFKEGSAYFKSTDGHTGVWKFSSRRLNLHLLEIIGKNDGCIVVDSTRRGKRMPDALSKTIPIWCSVINRFLFPDQTESHELYTPPQVVSESEHAQIAALLPGFLVSLQALNVPAQIYESHISKPLRPIWITPDSQLIPTNEVFAEFHPIICCTVSRRVPGGELSEGGYIQGAGDDTENWAYGLTPPVFWANNETILSAPEYELPDLILRLVQDTASAAVSGGLARCIKPTSRLFVSALSAIEDLQTSTNHFAILLLPKSTKESTWVTSSIRLDVGLGSHKLGSRNLRTALLVIIDFAKNIIFSDSAEDRRIFIACETGKDLSIGVALAFLCLFFDADGELLKEYSPTVQVDKAFVRRRLGWISTSMPDANPSRATLQSVNSFLINRP